MPTLEEVETFIAENGHLMGVPSAKEVEENGIELGDMNKLLLFRKSLFGRLKTDV